MFSKPNRLCPPQIGTPSQPCQPTTAQTGPSPSSDNSQPASSDCARNDAVVGTTSASSESGLPSLPDQFRQSNASLLNSELKLPAKSKRAGLQIPPQKT